MPAQAGIQTSEIKQTSFFTSISLTNRSRTLLTSFVLTRLDASLRWHDRFYELFNNAPTRGEVNFTQASFYASQLFVDIDVPRSTNALRQSVCQLIASPRVNYL